MGSREVLSRRQKEILIGTLLGDACLEKNGNHCRIRIEHKAKYKDYIFWFAKELAPFALKPRYVEDADKRNNNVYQRWHVSTKSLSVFERYNHLFYKDKIKIIPDNLSQLLTPLSLAVWYMDDGFKRKDSKGFYLCTCAYTEEEQKLVCEVLQKCFGIVSVIHHQRQYQRIFIPSHETNKFNSLIKPFVLPIFRYKLL